MKTNKMKFGKKLISLLIIILSITAISCNESENKNTESSTTEKVDKSITKPSMDIYAAVYMANEKALLQHIEIGTDLNKHDPYGSTPLNIAIVFGKTDIAIMLMKAGANVNALNLDGSSPLHTAAFFCRTEIVEQLLENGADKTIKNQYESTALQTVIIPFEDIKPVYLQIAKDLGPLGLRLDLERIELTRPQIAQLLSE